MEFQFHPASRRRAVRSLVLSPRGERVALVLAGLAALFSVSMWVTVPVVLRRSALEAKRDSIVRGVAEARRERRDLEARAAGLRDRALDVSDLLARIAFLYGISPSRWPRVLDPEAGVLSTENPERIAAGAVRYLPALERARAVLEEREAEDPTRAERTPSLVPVEGDLVEPSAVFGPRVSPWTGAEEFFPGVEFAAPEGSSVLAPAAGTVVFAGRVRPSPGSRLWRLGSVVFLSHGDAGVTVFGHLQTVAVRRGQKVRRGDRLGSVGRSGWTMSAVLHYEYWAGRGGALRPTDPFFAILDGRWRRRGESLEKMLATGAAGPVERLPGIGR